MRAIVFQHLTSDAALTALIPAERWVSGRSLEDAPPRPFAVVRFGGTFPGLAAVRAVRCEVWIHDDQGNYDLIDQVIELIKVRLDGKIHLTNVAEPGSEIMQATWQGDSTDLFDPALKTNTKSTAYDLVGRL